MRRSVATEAPKKQPDAAPAAKAKVSKVNRGKVAPPTSSPVDSIPAAGDDVRRELQYQAYLDKCYAFYVLTTEKNKREKRGSGAKVVSQKQWLASKGETGKRHVPGCAPRLGVASAAVRATSNGKKRTSSTKGEVPLRDYHINFPLPDQ